MLSFSQSYESHKYETLFSDDNFEVRNYEPVLKAKTYSEKGKDRSPEKHSDCMSIDDIYKLPVQDISADDCICFMWVTYPLLKEGIKTMEEWGFTYKTCAFSWIKQNKKSNSLFWGLGYWTRANNEICLLGTKGKPKRVSKGVHQVVMSPIDKHSKKPNVVKDRIVELCGDVPRIELFARQRTQGWDVWGNEVPDEETTEKITMENFL